MSCFISNSLLDRGSECHSGNSVSIVVNLIAQKFSNKAEKKVIINHHCYLTLMVKESEPPPHPRVNAFRDNENYSLTFQTIEFNSVNRRRKKVIVSRNITLKF